MSHNKKIHIKFIVFYQITIAEILCCTPARTTEQHYPSLTTHARNIYSDHLKSLNILAKCHDVYD